jgi:hypothetical protein
VAFSLILSRKATWADSHRLQINIVGASLCFVRITFSLFIHIRSFRKPALLVSDSAHTDTKWPSFHLFTRSLQLDGAHASKRRSRRIPFPFIPFRQNPQCPPLDNDPLLLRDSMRRTSSSEPPVRRRRGSSRNRRSAYGGLRSSLQSRQIRSLTTRDLSCLQVRPTRVHHQAAARRHPVSDSLCCISSVIIATEIPAIATCLPSTRQGSLLPPISSPIVGVHRARRYRHCYPGLWLLPRPGRCSVRVSILPFPSRVVQAVIFILACVACHQRPSCHPISHPQGFPSFIHRLCYRSLWYRSLGHRPRVWPPSLFELQADQQRRRMGLAQCFVGTVPQLEDFRE